MDAKDPSTRRHSERVAALCEELADALGWPPERCRLLRDAGLVHDVGKIGVPDAILFKPGRLTAEEYELVKEHAELGARIVAEALTPEQVSWVKSHHERWDGGGYPEGLMAEDIPEGARIMALADAWDVMTSERPYTAGPATPARAIAECRACSGSPVLAPGRRGAHRDPRRRRVIGSGGRRLAMAGVAVGLVAVGGLLALSVSLVTTDAKDQRELTVVVGPGGSTAPAPAPGPGPPATSARGAAPGGRGRTVAIASGGAAGAPGGAGPVQTVPAVLRAGPPAGEPAPPAPRGRRSRPAPRPPAGRADPRRRGADLRARHPRRDPGRPARDDRAAPARHLGARVSAAGPRPAAARHHVARGSGHDPAPAVRGRRARRLREPRRREAAPRAVGGLPTRPVPPGPLPSRPLPAGPVPAESLPTGSLRLERVL